MQKSLSQLENVRTLLAEALQVPVDNIRFFSWKRSDPANSYLFYATFWDYAQKLMPFSCLDFDHGYVGILYRTYAKVI
jgi:hypothetical protein